MTDQLSRFPKAAIDRLLRPKSVAIVGASSKPGALGANVLRLLKNMGFGGDIHLVNPKSDEIDGQPCVKSAADLPEGVDVAVLAIPRVGVLSAIRDLASRKCGSAIVFSAGFAEAGEEGQQEQREIEKISRETGMVIEGPNCLGLVNYVDGVALTFVDGPDRLLGDRKGVGMVSQSGAMVSVLTVDLASRDLGLSYAISTGNEAASGVEDYIEYLVEDQHTAVITLIVEQFRDPDRFLKLAKKAREADKPIVLLHPGRSAAAQASAATHTGAMAGDYKVMKTKVERAGVIVAETMEELGDITEIVARCPSLPSKGTAVMAESGALKAMILDMADDLDLHLPEMADADSPALREAMPEFVLVSNPVDMTAQGLVDPDMYRRTLTALVKDDRVGDVLMTIIQANDRTVERKFPPILEAMEALKPTKPVILAGADEGAEFAQSWINKLRDLNITYFPSTGRALRAIAKLNHFSARNYDSNEQLPLTVPTEMGTGVIPEYRAKAILAPLGIPFPKSELAKTKEEAVACATDLGLPVVLKAQSADLSHKSEAGGVMVGLESADAVASAWDTMHSNVKSYDASLELDGLLIEKMGSRGIELIIGARHEPGWGPVILAGFGGVQAELYQDVRLLAPDLTEEAIISELGKLQGAELLQGFRGQEPVDLQAVASIISIVGRLMLGEPTIREIDLNPVVVHGRGKGAIALDALMLVSQ